MTNKRRALVTGAAGFVGSHLVEELVRRGYQVRAFIRYTSTNTVGYLATLPAELLEEVELVAGDIRDSDAIRKAAQGTDLIFHLAALVGIPYSYVHPREIVETNMMGTLNVLMAALDCGVGHVIHTSTSEVYGTALYVPIDEAHPLQGQSPYSASKIGAEKLVESFYTSYGLPTTVIRPFNIFGPRQSTRAVIPTIITQALTQNEIRLGNLAATRDFTYVQDTVRGFMMASEADAAIGKVVNVGSNFEISIQQIAESIIRLVGRNTSLVHEENRLRPAKSEVQRLWAENRLARQLLGWQPEISFDEGLRQTIHWVSENLDRFRVGVYTV